MGNAVASSDDELPINSLTGGIPENTSLKQIFFIEGNISSGKSTLVRNLKAAGFRVYEERVDMLTTEYVDSDEENLLDLFYKDMKEHAFKLQIASLTTRWGIIKEAISYLNTPHSVSNDTNTKSEIATKSDIESTEDDVIHGISSIDIDKLRKNVVFIERSVLTDRFSFALNLYEQKNMSSLEWKIYSNLFSSHVSDTKPHFAGIGVKYIYLRTSPEECFQRKIKRGRVEEASIPLDYFKMLHQKNENWLTRDSKEFPGGNDPLFQEETILIDGHLSEQGVLLSVFELFIPSK